MDKKVMIASFTGLLLVMLCGSPVLADHRHAFERGFQDELGRIGAHAAVNLGVSILEGVLHGSGLNYGRGGYPYGGPGLINRAPGYYRPDRGHHRHRRHHYRDRVIKKKVYIYEEYYPKRHYRGHRGYYYEKKYYEYND
jgi:hypothetical protein